MIKREEFTLATNQKGKVYGDKKITNNSNYIVFYAGKFVGEVKTQKDAIKFIQNLIEHQKLTYTQH